MNRDQPPLTEAEYAAWAEAKARQLVGQFTALLPQETRDAGARFEYASIPLDALRRPIEELDTRSAREHPQ